MESEFQHYSSELMGGENAMSDDYPSSFKVNNCLEDTICGAQEEFNDETELCGVSESSQDYYYDSL